MSVMNADGVRRSKRNTPDLSDPMSSLKSLWSLLIWISVFLFYLLVKCRPWSPHIIITRQMSVAEPIVGMDPIEFSPINPAFVPAPSPAKKVHPSQKKRTASLALEATPVESLSPKRRRRRKKKQVVQPAIESTNTRPLVTIGSPPTLPPIDRPSEMDVDEKQSGDVVVVDIASLEKAAQVFEHRFMGRRDSFENELPPPSNAVLTPPSSSFQPPSVFDLPEEKAFDVNLVAAAGLSGMVDVAAQSGVLMEAMLQSPRLLRNHVATMTVLEREALMAELCAADEVGFGIAPADLAGHVKEEEMSAIDLTSSTSPVPAVVSAAVPADDGNRAIPSPAGPVSLWSLKEAAQGGRPACYDNGPDDPAYRFHINDFLNRPAPSRKSMGHVIGPLRAYGLSEAVKYEALLQYLPNLQRAVLSSPTFSALFAKNKEDDRIYVDGPRIHMAQNTSMQPLSVGITLSGEKDAVDMIALPADQISIGALLSLQYLCPFCSPLLAHHVATAGNTLSARDYRAHGLGAGTQGLAYGYVDMAGPNMDMSKPNAIMCLDPCGETISGWPDRYSKALFEVDMHFGDLLAFNVAPNIKLSFRNLRRRQPGRSFAALRLFLYTPKSESAVVARTGRF